MGDMDRSILKEDAFLAEHLARPCYSLDAAAFEEKSFPARFRAALGPGPAFVVAKTDCANVFDAARLCSEGFYPADVNLTLEAPLRGVANELGGARLAVSEDAAALGELARTSFVCSRFHRDPNIPRTHADAFKAAWVTNYFKGLRGDAMVVAEVDKQIAGFLQLLDQGDTVVIDLVAVDQQFRRQGVASAMLGRASAAFPEARTIRAGTQAANTGSLRFYQHSGFEHTASTMVFHYWKEK